MVYKKPLIMRLQMLLCFCHPTLAYCNGHISLFASCFCVFVSLGDLRSDSVNFCINRPFEVQKEAFVINTTSILGFVPLAATAIYSATKAALHNYTLSQRYMLKDTSVKVIEVVPPWVQSNNDEPRAMPLSSFIDATIKVLGMDTDEVLVEEAKMFRNNPGPNEGVFVTHLNDTMKSEPPKIH